jgi:uncharacterized protein with von Willebrand factor type A (vWA) domain
MRSPQNDLVCKQVFQKNHDTGDDFFSFLFFGKSFVIIRKMTVREVAGDHRQFSAIVINLDISDIRVDRRKHGERRRRRIDTQATARKPIKQFWKQN